jgi:L,D-transpeptidase ErfK/SrfK
MKPKKKLFVVCLLVASIIIPSYTTALTFKIQPNSDIIGIVQYTTVKNNATLFDVALTYDIGMFELLEANPKINPNKVKNGTQLIIPSAFVLPPGPREGVVLNLAELRIYFYHPNSNLVSTYPVGIGRIGWRTPVGIAKIIKKRENPFWRPPNSIRASAARRGKILPDVMPPGPDNPLGDYALSLSWANYLIHGTNKQNTVGLRSSSGCIRMYDKDIKELFYLVEKGTIVNFIHVPFKIGRTYNNLFLEAHQPLPEAYYVDDEDDEITVKKEIKEITKNRRTIINWANTNKEIKQTFGYPIFIGTLE